MLRSRFRQIANLIGVALVLVFNFLANALPLNGQNTGTISDRFSVYFVPAGYVFSIWGLIYLGLIAFAVFQALPGQRSNPRLAGADLPFLLSCLANVAWLFLWHYEQFSLTLLAMFGLLACLTIIYRRLEIGRQAVPAGERWLARLPFSLYLGWVSVATLANVTDVLEWVRWHRWGLSETTWAVILLVLAAGLAALVAFDRRDVVYLLVFVWALSGIAVKQAGEPLVATAAWAVAGVCAVLIAWVSLAPQPRPAR
jgi:benzodiazapine receptor